jgi:hypothetical protein
MSSASSSTNSSVSVGDVFEVHSTYGGSGHSLGPFIVTTVGSKFVCLKGIESEQTQVLHDHSDPASADRSVRCKVTQPIVQTAQKEKFSHPSYNAEEKRAITTQASGCYKTFTRIEPDGNNDYIYVAHSARFG